MDRERPLSERHIVLDTDPIGLYRWGCSHCYWTAAFLKPDGKAPEQTLEAVKAFARHRCADHNPKNGEKANRQKNP